MEVMRGVTFGFYARAGVFTPEWVREQAEQMVNTGVRWVVLCPTVMQETGHSTRQYRDFEVTPTDIELARAIEHLHGRGIGVQLRPMLETQDGQGRLQVWFQNDGERMPGRISDHWARWFESMRLRSVYYARLAADTGCEMYGLDSELDRTIHQSGRWREVVQAVRAVYPGPVTSCHTTHCGLIDYERVLADKTHWFYDLDLLSLSCYAKGADRPGASVEEMEQCLQPELERFRRFAALYGKPLCFGECGCTSSYGGAMSPSGWSGEGGYSPGEQANYLEAVLRTFWKEPWWHGLYWWKWDEQNFRPAFHSDPAGDKGFTLYGKPAAEVMRNWFARPDHA